MPETWVTAGYVLIPLGYGLVPAMLPRRVPLIVRWTLWLALLAAAAAYVQTLGGMPDPFSWLTLVPFSLSSLLSLFVLLVETHREGRGAKTGHSDR